MTEEKIDSINVGGRDFEVKNVLGKGGFSTVLKAVDKQTKKKVALKLTYTDAYKNQMQKQVSMHQIHKEIKTMRSLQEPNIIRLLGYDLKSKYQGRTCIVMVQELAPRRELFEYLMHSGIFTEKLARSVFNQLLTGLAVLHSKGITHRDLKPENLLFDGNFTLKIADFGFATAFEKGGEQKLVKTVLGTRGYMAPEIGGNKPYTEKVDVFATGVILFILISGFPPFRETRSSDWWWNKILQGKVNLFWMAHERKAPQFTTDVKNLITKMIAVNPDERPTITQIQEDVWSQGERYEKTAFQMEMKKRLEKVNRVRMDKQQGRDVLADRLRESIGGLAQGKNLEVAPIITNEIRNNFANAESASDVDSNLALLRKAGGFYSRLVDNLEFKVDKVEAAETLGAAMEVSEIQSVTNLSESHAKKLLEVISKIGIKFENYNHALTPTFIDLDDIEPPLLPENANACAQYVVRCGFGMVCLALKLFTDRKKGELEIDDEVCKCVVTIEVSEEEVVPVTEDTTETIVLDAKLEISVELYRMPDSTDNVVVFNNTTKGTDKYVTHQLYSGWVTEIITDTGIGGCIV